MTGCTQGGAGLGLGVGGQGAGEAYARLVPDLLRGFQFVL